MILADSVLDRPNPWADTFDAGRIGLKGGGAKAIVEESVDVAQNWIKEHVHPDDEGSVADLAPGEGGIVRSGDDLVAAFRDDDGTLHQVASRCSHLGCGLRWNAIERSWDCGCHGSRFDVDGKILHGPAVEELSAIDASGGIEE
jgi:Rieske Fe-S protein